MRVTLLAYRNHVLVLPSDLESTPYWSPVGAFNRSHLYSILQDTRAHLEASEEALYLLSRCGIGYTPLGDWDWRPMEDGTYQFAWFGCLFRLINPTQAVAAMGASVHSTETQIIPNIIPPNLAADVDQAIANGDSFFRLPTAIEDPLDYH